MKCVAAIATLAVATLVASSGALGRSAVDDLAVTVVLQASPGNRTVTGPSFEIAYLVETDGAVQTVTLRTTIPDGLRVAASPGASAGCTGVMSIVCVTKLQDSGGIVFFQYDYGLVADRAGTYSITATVEGERPDPNTANNSNTLQFQVNLPGGGGGSESVAVGSAKAKPSKPKAGSPVTFSASVKVGGEPAKPSKVTCAAKLGGRAKAGTSGAATGSASCRYTTKKADKSKTLTGSMKVTAGGTTFTKRFSSRLR
jgi:hypothetical protein